VSLTCFRKLKVLTKGPHPAMFNKTVWDLSSKQECSLGSLTVHQPSLWPFQVLHNARYTAKTLAHQTPKRIFTREDLYHELPNVKISAGFGAASITRSTPSTPSTPSIPTTSKSRHSLLTYVHIELLPAPLPLFHATESPILEDGKNRNERPTITTDTRTRRALKDVLP